VTLMDFPEFRADGTSRFRVVMGLREGDPPEEATPDDMLEYEVALRAVGVHQVENALAALAVAWALDLPMRPAIAALEAWRGAEGRMTIRRTPDGLTVLDDCYNAAPESMEAALNTLDLLITPD